MSLTAKYVLLLIGITFSLSTNACVCSHYKFMDKYVRSDFVARVSIVKNFPNQGAALHYRSEIKIEHLFKGKNVKSILVEGSSDGKKRTSCDIFFKEGTKLLVYARLDSIGQYIFDMCSGYRVLSNPADNGEIREVEMLNFLDRHNIRTTDKTFYSADLHDKLQPVKGINTIPNFAIYEITFASNLHVDSVRTVTGFNTEIDSRLAEILRGARWVSDRILIDGKKNEVPPGSKLLIGFYYYSPQATDARFISEWDL
ncbi:hypothetical protein LZD49_33710 [Dyadobacter sp. CY261]|uniref:hypothetical protein n=1 Tax=Dyadobacter sp. CY261 TaxID=2907203 RepID=UPI001F365AD6|nr:hypothetical protein [Dyadobacter sp. CY261]MCF0075484.1 hypothetical protein [Dyadobacter sp. CY261]